MSDFRLGVVITTCEGREQNLARTLAHLEECDKTLTGLVVVYDGSSSTSLDIGALLCPVHPIEIEKHAPGAEQPRNVGARRLRSLWPESTHVWFLDSDLIFGPDIVEQYASAHALVDLDRVLIGPYEWLPPERYDMPLDMRNDIRWASFHEHGPDYVFKHDLGCGLGNFGGNIVWPLDEFEWVGGFANELHHGRCEDGELGLRAAAAGIPMSLVRGARAWHVAHSVNMAWTLKANARDVPLLNSWHPEVQDEGFLLTEADGARFDFRCPEPGCDLIMNSHDVWSHISSHRTGAPFVYADPGSVRNAD